MKGRWSSVSFLLVGLGLAAVLLLPSADHEVLLAQGVVARQQGEMRVHARSEVTLALPEAPEKISTETDLRILFDLRLVEIR